MVAGDRVVGFGRKIVVVVQHVALYQNFRVLSTVEIMRIRGWKSSNCRRKR